MLTLEDFPELNKLTESSARNLFRRICEQYGFSKNSVELEFYQFDDHGGGAPLGLYQQGNDLCRAKVCIATSLFQRPAEMVATMAHELAHHLLLSGSGDLDAADEIDHEYLTDLVMVFTGFGVFAANCTVLDRSYGDGTMSYFEISKSGYLSSIQFGYALGLMAWMRNENSPAWINQLRQDAKETCRNTIRYLKKTGDAFVDPQFGSKPDCRSIDDLVSQSPTVRLATLTQWQLESRPIDQIAGYITKLLEDPVADIRVSAINLFSDGSIPLNPTSERALVRSLSSKDEQESLYACQALFQRSFAGVDELVRRSRFWFKKSNESTLARTTYTTIVESLASKDIQFDCKIAIVRKADRDLERSGEAETLLAALRKIPDLEAVLEGSFERWPIERKKGLVHFRDTGKRPVQL